jgi:type IV pilus assembly protein PilE
MSRGHKTAPHPTRMITALPTEELVARQRRPSHADRGFTLIELMIVVAVVAVLAALAYPSYTRYVFRSRVIDGPNALSALAVRLEQRFQDVGGYGIGTNGSTDGACGIAPAPQPNFTVTCASLSSGSEFLATARATGLASGEVVFTIDHAGVRKTTAHPYGLPPGNCWSIRGGICDN